jgi:hypothetical protein
MSLDHKLLGIYLNDHLAGATVGRELAGRAAGSNRDNEYGVFLERLQAEIAEDREALRELMDELDVGEDMIKTVFALVAERAGRLKLNGSLTSYSPLSRLVEIEGLLLGVNGKLSLWRALRELDDPRLPDTRLDELERRAERQCDELEDHRLMAAREAFEDG